MTRWTTIVSYKEHKTAARNWLDLPRDLTLMIISRLDTFQILTSAQKVCRQWRSICKDPLMWRTINMCDIGIYNSVDFKLEEMCRYAIDRSCGLLEDISIEYFGSDDLLKYIADSQCQLRRLRLVQCFYRISDEGLCEIAQRFPMLEELDLTLVENVSSVALKAIGRGCPLLKSFKFNECGDGNEEAFAIAHNMSNLRHLQLVNNDLDNSAVSAILNGCPRLESLDLRQCYKVEMEEELRRRCDEQLKDFIEPDTPHEFRGYKFGYLNYELAYDDFTFEYISDKKKLSEIANSEKTQDDGELLDKEKEGGAAEEADSDWGEIYGIWECVKNQRSRNAFKTYLTEKEKKKKKKKKNYKSKGKKKHIRKEGALITTKAYVSCFEMEESE